MLPTDVFRRILRRALQQEQASFRNNVVSAMMSVGDSLTTPFRLPSEELGLSSGTPGQLQLAPVVVKGRCSAVDLLVCPLGSSCKSLRAVNYTRLLKYADLDGLLALAQKVQLHAMQRTTSMALEEPRAEPVNKAMLALQRAAEAAARHLAGDEGGSPRSPSSPRPAGSLAEQTAGACSLSISQQLPASQGQAVRS